MSVLVIGQLRRCHTSKCSTLRQMHMHVTHYFVRFGDASLKVKVHCPNICIMFMCILVRISLCCAGLSSWGTSTAEFQFFDLLQKQVSVIAPYNYAKLWELYSTATARTATGVQASSTSEAEMYRKFRF